MAVSDAAFWRQAEVATKVVEMVAELAEIASLRENGGDSADMCTVKRSYLMELRGGLSELGSVGEALHKQLDHDLKKASFFRGSPNIGNHVVRVPYLFSRAVVTP
jgi:hypothetical protein